MLDIIQNFSEKLQTGELTLALSFASFFGGIIASISPCTLGILPIIIGYIAGYDENRNPYITLVQMISFVFGLSVILTAIGIFCAIGGKVFMALGGSYFIIFMASLIMIFGLNLLGLIEIPTPNFIKKMPKSKGASLFVYPFILGFMFALASTPCSTPILASIMSFASLSKNIWFSALLLFLFSLGQGIIIILAGVFASFIKNIRGINKYSGILMKICGILLVLSSLLIFYNVFSKFFT